MRTILSSDIARIFEERKDNPQYNTSYPLSPKDWETYITHGLLPFNGDLPMAFYIHIPFCKNLCSFCEYTRTIPHSINEQEKYVGILDNDITVFLNKYDNVTLYGLDIGGGTPTALDDNAFRCLMGSYSNVLSRVKVTDDFEPSIEATFQTLTPEKLSKIYSAKIKRISLGLQAASKHIVTSLNRETISLAEMKYTLSQIYSYDIKKVNIDLMYGLPGQNLETLLQDIKTIEQLNPEQVSIYELRTNQLKNHFNISQSECFKFYNFLYEHFIKLGYFAQYGANTFSRNKEDLGLSSYLRHRMLDGWQYKGFGISAQSMSQHGISYNIGKNQKDINKIITKSHRFESENYYKLSNQELLSKFIAISGYSGGFSLQTAKQIYGESFEKDFGHVLDFLIENHLIFINSNRAQLTSKGLRHYGAILSLFFPSS